jgi:hypothetical protein
MPYYFVITISGNIALYPESSTGLKNQQVSANRFACPIKPIK